MLYSVRNLAMIATQRSRTTGTVPECSSSSVTGAMTSNTSGSRMRFVTTESSTDRPAGRNSERSITSARPMATSFFASSSISLKSFRETRAAATRSARVLIVVPRSMKPTTRLNAASPLASSDGSGGFTAMRPCSTSSALATTASEPSPRSVEMTTFTRPLRRVEWRVAAGSAAAGSVGPRLRRPRRRLLASPSVAARVTWAARRSSSCSPASTSASSESSESSSSSPARCFLASRCLRGAGALASMSMAKSSSMSPPSSEPALTGAAVGFDSASCVSSSAGEAAAAPAGCFPSLSKRCRKVMTSLRLNSSSTSSSCAVAGASFAKDLDASAASFARLPVYDSSFCLADVAFMPVASTVGVTKSTSTRSGLSSMPKFLAIWSRRVMRCCATCRSMLPRMRRVPSRASNSAILASRTAALRASTSRANSSASGTSIVAFVTSARATRVPSRRTRSRKRRSMPAAFSPCSSFRLTDENLVKCTRSLPAPYATASASGARSQRIFHAKASRALVATQYRARYTKPSSARDFFTSSIDERNSSASFCAPSSPR
mmetsp:Transcript_48231/g.148820  ORF Transcript_48231/g.148820 Transcript_48231/m.148820 type:complete len:549 (+) Transcript_48231:888-2534(+)